MFLNPNPKNFHVQYPDVNRHWSQRSESFAGADSLVTAMMRGWDISHEVHKEEYWLDGARCVNLYHFRLRKNDREIVMPVLENPYVTRLLFMSPFEVMALPEDKANEVYIG